MIEERITPNISDESLVQEHLDRYMFASKFTYDTNVLDIACGTGYGTHMLAENAKYVVGVDISYDAIEYAKSHYNKPNITFTEGNALVLPFADNTFDVVVSFETIEHINNYRQFLRECNRVLKTGGTFICSTPNAAVSSPDGNINNPYHVMEFTKNEFNVMLLHNFNVVEILGQHDINMIKHRIFNLYFKIKQKLKINKALFPQNKQYTSFSFPIGLFKDGITKSAYMIAVCTK